MIKSINKKIIVLISVICITSTLISCGKKNNTIGHGQKGKTPDIEWSEFDNMIKKIKTLDASKERDLLMHQAEEKAMSLYCTIPINSLCTNVLCQKDTHGFYVDVMGTTHLDTIYFDGNRKVANIQLGSEPTTMDPGLSFENVSNNYITGLYGSLITYDIEGKIKYHYLKDYKVSNDGLTHTFTIKDNIKWSDGVPLKAKDFVYSLKRHANPNTGGQLSYLLSSIKGFPYNLDVNIIDDTSFYVKTNSKTPYLLSIFYIGLTVPLRQDIVESDKNWFLKTPYVTPGPYILKEWKHKESMVLEKNENYFEKDRIKIDKINLMLNSNETSIYNAYKTKNLDIAINIPKDIITDELQTFKNYGVQFIRFNTKDKIFEGLTEEEAIKFRKAISYCIDRDFIEKMSSGRIIKAYTMANDTVLGYDENVFMRNTDEYKNPYENGYVEDINLDNARELLKEIGYHFDEKGKVKEDIAFEMLVSKANYDYASIIQNDLNKIGISVKIRKLDNSFVATGKYSTSISGWYADYCDPLAMIEIFESTNDNNTSFIGRELPS